MDERELIWQMKSGDRTSFDQIYEKYHVPLFRSAYLICGNREDAEDVLQDTFVTCWLCIGQLRKEESFRCWIFRIMTQAARKRAKERSRQLPDEEQTAPGRGHSEQDRPSGSEPQNGSGGRIRTNCRQSIDRSNTIRTGPGVQRSDRSLLL